MEQYEIQIKNHLEGEWRNWLETVAEITRGFTGTVPVTVLTTAPIDQATLLALLRRLHGEGLDLLAVHICSRHGPRREERVFQS